MSFLSKLLISAPVNVVATLGLGAPIGPVPSVLGLAFFTSPAGNGSDRVPLFVTTPDGSAFRLLGDPDGIWRNAYDGEPVSLQHQIQLTFDWNVATAALNAMLPPLFNPYQILSPSIPSISASCNTATTSALNYVEPRKDPLVLDLDGGGITTSGINPAAPILFDQDGDGTRTATGWIAAGEAIVVRDLNGNGLIDSGRELLGDNTILTHGPNTGQTAANGFAALADLDANASGVADGKFDSSDVAFSSVKLWKDLNQDGVSQAGELLTFAQLGIQSINVTGTASNVNLGGGNTQTFSGSFTRTDGKTGSNGAAQEALIHQAYDVLKNSVYGALVVQTRLKPYLDSIEQVVDEMGVRFDTVGASRCLASSEATWEAIA